MDKFSELAGKYIDKGLIAGLEWEIRHFNKIVSKDVKGYSDVENKTVLKPGQIYRIYSMTKPIVSVAAIRLIEACKLSLYSNIQDFIPSLAAYVMLLAAQMTAKVGIKSCWQVLVYMVVLSLAHVATTTCFITFYCFNPYFFLNF